MNVKLRYNNHLEDSLSSKIGYLVKFVTKAILYSIMALFVILILAILLYFVDSVYNMKTKNNRPPLFNAFVIVSQSMVPNINVNDAVVIKRVEPKKLKIGDIITFSSNDPNYTGLTVTHRIIGKDISQNGKYIFRTKGDNNNSEDPSLVEEGKIYGKVLFRIPKLGYIRHFLTTARGFIICIVIPALGIVIFDIIKLIKKIKLYYTILYEEEKRKHLDLGESVTDSKSLPEKDNIEEEII